MANMRRMMIMGRLTADPEIRATASGSQVVNFRVATNYKDAKGTEQVEFTRIVAFDRQAGYIGQYAKKGDTVYVDGTYRENRWKNDEGKEVVTPELRTDNFQLLDTSHRTRVTATEDISAGETVEDMIPPV